MRSIFVARCRCIGHTHDVSCVLCDRREFCQKLLANNNKQWNIVVTINKNINKKYLTVFKKKPFNRSASIVHVVYILT